MRENKGQATKIDRILILSKGTPKKPNFKTETDIVKEFS